MISRRFLAVIARGTAPLSSRHIDEGHRAASGLTQRMATGRLALWCDHRALGGEQTDSAIVGAIHDRGDCVPLQDLSAQAWQAVAQSNGQRLVERCWGNFVAFLSENGLVSIVRAPLGDISCYYCVLTETVVASSDLGLLRAVAGQRAIDDLALARHLDHPDWRRGETCLQGVLELRGGDRLTIGRDGALATTLWSPWAFVARDRAIEDRDQATRAVREAVRLAVRARCAPMQRLVLLLSGGLDSSIVAANLARADADFTCLNLAGEDAASDELRYARTVAEAFDVALLTRRFEAERVDVLRSGAAHMPYPVHRCFTQAQDSTATEVARQIGADAVIDGGGGDNVFFSSRTLAILADCLVAGGFDRRFWDTARALGDLTQMRTWTLAWRAIGRTWLRSSAPRPQPPNRFLAEQVRAAIEHDPPHPWFAPPRSISPGRASHVALLVPAQNLAEAINAQASMPAISPLVSQPVIEACLRVPSWHWIETGLDRAAARRAFARDLPGEIACRRSKGNPTGFVAAIFDQNRAAIREMLLGGELVARGLLDRERLARCLGQPGPARGFSFVQIMDLVDAEAWVRAQR